MDSKKSNEDKVVVKLDGDKSLAYSVNNSRDENLDEGGVARKKGKKKTTKKTEKIQNENSKESQLTIASQAKLFEAKEQDYLKKISNLESLLEQEKKMSKNLIETHKAEMEEKVKEIREKEKSVNSISMTNAKLMQALEELRKEVDQQFEKVNIKQVKKRGEKEKEKENKQNPLKIVIKVKEKELKNANQMVEILRKDNEQLLKNIGAYDFKNVLEAQDKLKIKEKENQELLIEIRTLNRALEEHRRCPGIRKDLENEMRKLKEDVKTLKDTVHLKDAKIKEDKKIHDKTVNQLISLKQDYDKLVKLNKAEGGNKILIDKKKVNNLNHDGNIMSALNTEEREKVNVSVSVKDSIPLKDLSPSKKLIIIQRNKSPTDNPTRSITMDTKTPHKLIQKKLFSLDEISKFEKIMDKSDLQKIEKKFEALDHSKQSVENKHKSDVKILMKKINDQQERLEFTNLQLKEAEQKSKIGQFQINEYRNEQKVYQRKLNEMHGLVDSLSKTIKEKEQENKILVNQLSSMRKVVKHNAVPPMDSELARHIEKIKNEESLSESGEDMEEREGEDMEGNMGENKDNNMSDMEDEDEEA